MSKIQERGSTHVYKVNKISKEEMDSMVSLCVYEDPPYCNAACPLKLDTRALMKAVAEGDFKKALQIYEKIAPFPVLLSQCCEAPCEGRCRMGEVGEGISIRDIEATVAANGEVTKSGGVFRRKKRQTVALFGSGLFALFLAGEIEKKMYPLTVFCEEADIEAYLKSAAAFLDEQSFAIELKRLKSKDIDFVFGCELSPKFFEEKRADFNVLCASEEAAKCFFKDAQCDRALMYYEAEKLVMGSGSGTMDAAFGAKKAALTVDRLAQKLSPANMRGEEGAVDTRLYTDMSEARELKRVAKSGAVYTKEEAMAEAQRCIQCRCEECMKSCAYLKHYKKHPGLLSREIYNNTQIIMGDHQLNKPMNSCSLCGQCAVVCPNGFDMAQVCHAARRNMVSTDKMPLAPHEFALLDMLFSNEEAFLARPQPGVEKCKYVFFPGCQASAIAPATVRAAYEDLSDRLEGGVALMLGCCGAICDWAGRYEMQETTREFIKNELSKLGDPIIIAGCPTCKKELSESVGGEIIGIWDVLEQIGLPEGAKGLSRPAAMHDSCGARGDEATQNAIRDLAAKLGCELLETEYQRDESPCCGYGGLTMYANREVAHEMAEKCLERSDAPYISYCMACRDRFAREGRESRHILELVYGTDAGNPPDISEKRWNRLTLKNNMLREIWGEESEMAKLPYELNFSDEALEMMDDRMILKSDVIAVIEHMRETGAAIDDEDTGYIMANHRVGNVTFWVALTEDAEGYTVHRAYSHRMKIVKGNG
ncbi:MAG: 4Fe-4S dicluster domain-containing protein [Oscillospiraceae bacterium]|nr:4Fe-4S dicluster domain-containing protein [Oscillospiraceae bacterium]